MCLLTLRTAGFQKNNGKSAVLLMEKLGVTSRIEDQVMDHMMD